MKIHCPRCKQETEYSTENPFRPFCSERCKLIDLSQWADGKYAIPVTEQSELGQTDTSPVDDEHFGSAEALPSPTDHDGTLH